MPPGSDAAQAASGPAGHRRLVSGRGTSTNQETPGRLGHARPLGQRAVTRSAVPGTWRAHDLWSDKSTVFEWPGASGRRGRRPHPAHSVARDNIRQARACVRPRSWRESHKMGSLSLWTHHRHQYARRVRIGTPWRVRIGTPWRVAHTDCGRRLRTPPGRPQTGRGGGSGGAHARLALSCSWALRSAPRFLTVRSANHKPAP